MKIIPFHQNNYITKLQVCAERNDQFKKIKLLQLIQLFFCNLKPYQTDLICLSAKYGLLNAPHFYLIDPVYDILS